MVKIWKYSVPGHCEGKIRQVLNVELQYGKPVVWVVLDDDIEETRAIDFYTVGTGWELEGGDAEVMRNSAYLGTVKDEEGFIWHCFAVSVLPEEERKKQEEELKETQKKLERVTAKLQEIKEAATTSEESNGEAGDDSEVER